MGQACDGLGVSLLTVSDAAQRIRLDEKNAVY